MLACRNEGEREGRGQMGEGEERQRRPEHREDAGSTMNVDALAQDGNELTWFKSSYSGDEGGECVEVAAIPSTVHVRDSKDPHGPQLGFTPESWTAFVAYASEF